MMAYTVQLSIGSINGVIDNIFLSPSSHHYSVQVPRIRVEGSLEEAMTPTRNLVENLDNQAKDNHVSKHYTYYLISHYYIVVNAQNTIAFPTLTLKTPLLRINDIDQHPGEPTVSNPNS
jgi:hypothetical protein